MTDITCYINNKVTIYTKTMANGSIIMVCAKYADGDIYCVKRVMTSKGPIIQPISKLCFDVLAQEVK